jgi:hypothetical protein
MGIDEGLKSTLKLSYAEIKTSGKPGSPNRSQKLSILRYGQTAA